MALGGSWGLMGLGRLLGSFMALGGVLYGFGGVLYGFREAFGVLYGFGGLLGVLYGFGVPSVLIG